MKYVLIFFNSRSLYKNFENKEFKDNWISDFYPTVAYVKEYNIYIFEQEIATLIYMNLSDSIAGSIECEDIPCMIAYGYNGYEVEIV